jgi:hypothetical protein
MKAQTIKGIIYKRKVFESLLKDIILYNSVKGIKNTLNNFGLNYKKSYKLNTVVQQKISLARYISWNSLPSKQYISNLFQEREEKPVKYNSHHYCFLMNCIYILSRKYLYKNPNNPQNIKFNKIILDRFLSSTKVYKSCAQTMITSYYEAMNINCSAFRVVLAHI